MPHGKKSKNRFKYRGERLPGGGGKDRCKHDLLISVPFSFNQIKCPGPSLPGGEGGG